MPKHYVFGERVNASLVVLPEGVLVVDTSVSPEGAQEVFTAAGKFGKIMYVINSHEHGDHLAGNHLFSCPILSSALAWERMGQEKVAPRPTITFSHELTLHFSEPVFLRHFGGHSPGSAVVYFPRRKLLFTGDLVFAGQLPYMGEGNFSCWIEALKTMEAWDVQTVVPGHGAQGGKELLVKQRQWLESYIQTVLGWVAEDLSPQEMLELALSQFQVVEPWQKMLLKSFQLIKTQFS